MQNILVYNLFENITDVYVILLNLHLTPHNVIAICYLCCHVTH